MQWEGRRESDNVEDRRSFGGRGLAVGGGIGSLVIGLIIYLLGGNPSQVLNTNPGANGPEMTAEQKAAQDKEADMIKVVLADTENIWDSLFTVMHKHYTAPTLVLFTESDQSGCGSASAATGPFYCPSDQKVYLDLSFFDEMDQRFHAPGNFAEAYVVAHEVGHHVQNLLGITEKVDEQRGQLSEEQMNALSVKVELQADFLAGMWAHYNNEMQITQSDITEALNAANAIGDDRLQKESQGYVVPDAFTHGTSAQRMYWFKKGYTTGDINQGDTFNAPDL